ncbi:hydrogenase-2 assembly chaperone [Enterobacteriaceae bacterium 89]|nr:hydrogenase-2 assembly chaperone [Enterobacteriaceae bacterium 89]
MSEMNSGFADDPSAMLEATFQAIGDEKMQTLPFYQAQIPVRACGFQRFEGQWVGCLLTPWMLSLLVLPGPGQFWQPRGVGEKVALSLPCGSVRFTVGETDACGQYLAASLMSPLERGVTASQMIALAEQTARMALAFPLAPQNPGRRALFGLGDRHARA